MSEVKTVEDTYYCPLCGKDAYITLIRHIPSDKVIDFRCSTDRRCIIMPLAISLVEKTLEEITETKKEIYKDQ